MSFQWADIPSGQPGLYGNDGVKMLDGTPWTFANLNTLVNDPDAVNFPLGKSLKHGNSSAGPPSAFQMALPNPHQKVGLACRFWMDNLPPEQRAIFAFNSVLNNVNYCVGVLPNGGVRISRGSPAQTGTDVARIDSPILSANTWAHIELLIDAVTGEIEFRKNGAQVPLLTVTDPSPPGLTTGIIAFSEGYSGQGGSGGIFKSKDIVVYNGAGSQFNSFQGTVGVNDLIPNSDSTLGDWTTSSGANAWDLINESPPNDAGYIQSAVPPSDPAIVGLTDLPVDVTTVRAVVMIARAFNSDSGDGNLQMGVSGNAGVDTDLGANRPATVSPAYYHDASELSPATGVSWTPSEVNNIIFSFDRTV